MRQVVAATVLLLVCSSALAGQLIVATDADSGPGSLRQRLRDANAGLCERPCSITFGSNVHLIAPQSPLPSITASDITISGGSFPPYKNAVILDGTHAGYRSGLKIVGASDVMIQDLVVINFEGHGIFFDQAIDGGVRFCQIGIDPRTNEPAPNQMNGVAVRGGHGQRIATNIIGSNNGSGVYVVNSERVNVGGNYIGHSFAPTAAHPNGAFGIFFDNAVHCTVENSEITFNKLSGVAIVAIARAWRSESSTASTTTGSSASISGMTARRLTTSATPRGLTNCKTRPCSGGLRATTDSCRSISTSTRRH